ncbi:MAG: DctP family TRAP transporter solute-binding subunit [Magnetococcales bacterium]|nr:DctP family TRAP transporter solute-binding subunit [Magnetococcales bacterium]
MSISQKKTKTKVATVLTVALFLTVVLYYFLTPKKTQPSINNPKEKSHINLRFGHNISSSSAIHLAAEKFARQLEEKSNGEVKITVHPNQELGNDHTMLDMAKEGELDIILTPTAKLSISIPAMQYADLPFYFPNKETLFEMLDGEPGQLLLKKLQPIGLIGVSFWGNGFKQFTTNKPINLPDDFTGMNVRVMKSRLLMEQFKSFGANPIAIDFHETKKALANHVVDGQENPLVAIVGMGFHEVQSHLTLSNHAYLGYVLSFSKKTFDALPVNIQEILIETGKKLTKFQRQETDRKEAQFLKIIKEAGVQVHTLTKKEQEEFAKRTSHLPRQFEGIIGADIISKTEELLMAKKSSDNSMVIGLDADLSLAASLAGLSIKRGIKLAIEEINKNGGVLGKKLTLLARDHQGMPTRGRKNIQFFNQKKDIVAIFGGLHSSIINSELDIINQSGIPFLIPWAAAASLTEKNRLPNAIFRNSINDSLAGPFLLNYALNMEQQAKNNIALLLENSVWGRGFYKSIKTEIDRKKLSTPIVEWLNKGQDDFLPTLRKLKQSSVTTVILVSNPKEGVKIVNGINKLKAGISIVSHWGVTGGNSFWEDTKDSLSSVNMVFPQTFSFIDNKNQKANQVSKLYIKNYGLDTSKEIPVPVGTAQAYDLLHLLALAIEKAGSVDPSAIRTALENLGPYEGLIKTYSPAFSTSNHDGLDQTDYFMAKYNKNGRIVPILQEP